MKYALRDIKAEALNFNINRIKVDKDTRIEIRPKFSRTVRRVQENDKIWLLVLEVKVESTDAEPTPFNMDARLVGVFEAEEVENERELVINMTEIVYPYLRAAVSSLTSTAMINPMILPVIPAGTLFPEDREAFGAPESLN
ncbi:MAG: protein-export chaperone SecB [Clostridia bacterium]|nr:protein-export chaperone SecB [Clostridia bacterium]